MKPLLNKQARKQLAEDINKILRPEITHCFVCNEEFGLFESHELTRNGKYIGSLCGDCTHNYREDINYCIEKWIETHKFKAKND